ncbi:hypothetical protein ABCR94_13590 [Streptomyces sp. 21So2-11]|uniref:hypothetical protein n=1 Tax=Streptomyces sp. 21So2-11 TaxID=3144408 RepID=UPI00321C0C83
MPVTALAVRSGTLILFAEWCWMQPARPSKPGKPPGPLTSPATIDRRLAGVVVTGRRQHRLPLAVDIAEEAHVLLKAKKIALEKSDEVRGRGPVVALLIGVVCAVGLLAALWRTLGGRRAAGWGFALCRTSRAVRAQGSVAGRTGPYRTVASSGSRLRDGC